MPSRFQLVCRYVEEILFMKEEELAAAEDVRQERDVLAQMVRTLQEREHAAGPVMRGGGGAGQELKAAGAAAAAELKKASAEMKNKFQRFLRPGAAGGVGR